MARIGQNVRQVMGLEWKMLDLVDHERNISHVDPKTQQCCHLQYLEGLQKFNTNALRTSFKDDSTFFCNPTLVKQRVILQDIAFTINSKRNKTKILAFLITRAIHLLH